MTNNKKTAREINYNYSFDSLAYIFFLKYD